MKAFWIALNVTLSCRLFARHRRWKRHELQYLHVADDRSEVTNSNELKQCAFCETIIVIRSDSNSHKEVYGGDQFEAANDVFQRAQLLGFEGSHS